MPRLSKMLPKNGPLNLIKNSIPKCSPKCEIFVLGYAPKICFKGLKNLISGADWALFDQLRPKFEQFYCFLVNVGQLPSETRFFQRLRIILQ